MCGKPTGGKLEDLPAWYQECAAKGTSEQYKLIIIQKFIMNTYFYEDSDVPLTSSMIKMVMKRAWTGKDGNINWLSIIYAMEGLSPFLMQDLN